MPQGLGAGSPMDQRALILSLGDAGAEIVARIGPRLPGNPRLVSCIHDQRLEQSDVSGDLSQGVLLLRFHHVVPLDETLRGLDLAMAPATRLHRRARRRGTRLRAVSKHQTEHAPRFRSA